MKVWHVYYPHECSNFKVHTKQQEWMYCERESQIHLAQDNKLSTILQTSCGQGNSPTHRVSEEDENPSKPDIFYLKMKSFKCSLHSSGDLWKHPGPLKYQKASFPHQFKIEANLWVKSTNSLDFVEPTSSWATVRSTNCWMSYFIQVNGCMINQAGFSKGQLYSAQAHNQGRSWESLR